MRDEYTITIRGPIPTDLADRISDIHAIAVVSAGRNEEIFPSRRGNPDRKRVQTKPY